MRYSNFVGVLGWPLERTASPPIHNAAFRRLGLDWTYLTWPVAPEGLVDAVAGLKALGARGANVTMPHKGRAAEMMDDLTPEAEALEAINTIEYVGGRSIGHNTDVEGFKGLLDDIGARLEERTALVLGAGGAARAIVKALGDLKAGSITIAARDPIAAAPLEALAAAAQVIGWSDAAGTDADVIVNCTPVGSDGSSSPMELKLHPAQTVIDLIYQVRTPLLEAAKAAGAEGWGGVGMLVHQAAASFRIWTGQEPPVEVMSAAALHALRGGVSQPED